MSRLNAANNAQTLLVGAITDTDTVMTVLDGSIFPEPPFLVTVEDEIIEVRAKTGNVFGSLLRGQEGTVAVAHADGVEVQNRMTVGMYDSLALQEDVTDLAGTGRTIETVKGNADDLAAHLTDDVHIGLNPACAVYNNVSISIPNNVWTDITFNSEIYDNAAMHSTSTNTNKIVVPVAGKYLVVAKVAFSNTSETGYRGAILYKSDTLMDHFICYAVAGFYTYINLVTVINMAVNDYVKVQAIQNSGGALNVEYNYSYPALIVMRIA